MNRPEAPDSGRKRVVVAMSGGVDSSVAAALLVEQGYEVIGMMMRLWSEPGRAAFNRCCTPDQLADARRIAAQLGIPFYAVDVKEHFRRTIVQFFIDEYAAGRTPNPCIECNRHIRFEFLLERALALGADYLATGHYARIRHTAGGYELHQGVDAGKDQSYVLHVMGQSELSRVLFPVGECTKAEVRDLAERFGLAVAKKSESMDLCFLGKDSYQDFLQRNAPDIGRAGPIVDTSGEQLGTHRGLPFYTIGQRKGLGVSAPEPLYVIRKETAENALVVGTRSELGRQSLQVRKVNWIAGEPPAGPISAAVKIRYKSRPAPGVVAPGSDATAVVTFEEPVFGVAPGQGAVFYHGSRCLGGGLIVDSRFEPEIDGALQPVSVEIST